MSPRRSDRASGAGRATTAGRQPARGKWARFAVVAAIVLLIASQVLIFSPGTDVSPYAFNTNTPLPRTYGGATVQVWAILLLLAVCGVRFVLASPLTASAAYRWTVAAVVTVSASGAVTSDSFPVFVEGVGKLALPLLLFLYFTSIAGPGIDRTLTKLIIVVNLFTVGQAVLARALTGQFSANRYYLELPQEYFGYFYHPFAFAGILGACSIVLINEIRQRRHRYLMTVLITTNVFFIFQSQVRTYILATAVAFIISLIGLTVGRRSARATFLIASVLSLVGVSIGSGLVAGSRNTLDASSGRLDRWALDVEYTWDTASVGQLLFGGGPGFISEVNSRLFGVQINSLNALVDVFVDFGLIGLILVVAAWATLLREHYSRARNPLVLAVVTLLGISALVTSPIEFPAVVVIMVVAAWAISRPPAAEDLSDPGEPVRSHAHVTGGSGRYRPRPGPRMHT